MAESLFSPLWYRVAEQHPHLRAEVRVQRQQVRDQRWFLLLNGANGRQFRVNQKAYEFIGRCDGVRSVQQVWDELLESLRDDAPTQDEVIQTLNQLDEEELIAYESAPQAQTLVRRRDERSKTKAQGFVNPFALRIPMGNPSALLQKLERFPGLLFNAIALSVWLAVVIPAAAIGLSYWHPFAAHAAEYMASPRYVLLAWIAFPILKALHELGHALAVRRWGGEVHEAGFSLFVFVPAPYVDASASAGFASRFQRFVVAAAGMMVELSIAALALVVWLNVQPGLIRDCAFVTMFIASVSTLVFNGNPLLRFDAYYILCDALDLPNLDTRSKAWWTQTLQRVLSGNAAPAPMQLARGERKWLVAYAPLAFAYRLAVSTVLVVWLGAHSTLIAVVAGVCLAFAVVLKPLWISASRLYATVPMGSGRKRAAFVAAAAGSVLLVVICAVPMPFHTTAAAVVWPPEQARVRLGTDGFVSRVLARDGERVAAGQVLIALDDPALTAEHDKLVSRMEQLQADRFAAATSEKAGNAEEEIARVQSELDRANERIAQLEVRAQTAGTLVMPNQSDLEGSFVRQGATIGHILESADVSIRAAVPEADAGLLREQVRAVEVRMADSGGAAPAKLVRDIPAATYELPSAVLGERGGGPHAVDPADKEGLHTREPVVLIDLKVPARTVERIGTRAWVRFDHGAQPLAMRWYRQARQVLLQHFNPAG